MTRLERWLALLTLLGAVATALATFVGGWRKPAPAAACVGARAVAVPLDVTDADVCVWDPATLSWRCGTWQETPR